jgi:hypothetical protein
VHAAWRELLGVDLRRSMIRFTAPVRRPDRRS